MKKTLILFSFCLWISSIIYAQVGKIGINTTTPAAMLHVKDSSVVFTGVYQLPSSPGNPPISGSGTRMMWYPDKGVFRAGSVGSTQWDKNNIGQYSFAVGENVKASSPFSIAMGHEVNATNFYSIALGESTISSGYYSFATGS